MLFMWHKIIPYRTFGDAARTQRRRSNPQKIMNLTWQSSTTRGCSWDIRLIFTVIPVNQMITSGPHHTRTMHHLLEAYTKGFAQLETGIMPLKPLVGETNAFKNKTLEHDRRGEHIAGGYLFAFTGSKGDLEFHHMTYHGCPLVSLTLVEAGECLSIGT